jgi:hypothetical protein
MATNGKSKLDHYPQFARLDIELEQAEPDDARL